MPDKNVMDAIAFTESSNRPDVVGDGGESIGLMQIQKNTAKGLYKQGLLPEKWKGKKVKRNDLEGLLKDPDFNKAAAMALYKDNKMRLKSVAERKGIPVSDEQLDDMAIKAHNQGVTKTIDRELLGNEAPLGRVNEYLNKVKSRAAEAESQDIQQELPQIEQQIPQYQEGGIAPIDFGPGVPINPEPMIPSPLDTSGMETEPKNNLLYGQETVPQEIPSQSPQEAPEEPEMAPNAPTPSQEKPVTEEGLTPTEANITKELNLDEQDKLAMKTARNVQDPKVTDIYNSILADYNDAVSRRDSAKKKQAKLRILDALVKFGAQYSAATAQKAGGFEVKAPQAGVEIPSVDELSRGDTTKDVIAKYNLLKDLQKAQKNNGLTEYQKEALKLRRQQLELQGKAEDRRLKGFDFKKIQKYQDDARSTVKDMRQTDSWKNAEKTLSTVPELELLLEDAYNKGGQSLAMLGPKVAKGIAGEVGVLTEADVTRYVKNPALVGGMVDTLAKLKDGKISEASYENLKRLLSISKQAADDKLKAARLREARLFSKREGVSLEDAAYLLDSSSINEQVDSDTKSKNEIKRFDRKTGRTAIFDSNTKKFLRWDD